MPQTQDAFIIVTAIEAAIRRGNLNQLLLPPEKARLKAIFHKLRNSQAYKLHGEDRLQTYINEKPMAVATLRKQSRKEKKAG